MPTAYSSRILCCLVLAISASTVFADTPSPGWQKEAVLFHDGLDRWYRVYAPKDLPDNAPLVLLLHGGTGSMRKIFMPGRGATLRWPVLAEQEKFLLVAPNGVHIQSGDPKGNKQNWNDVRHNDGLGNTSEDDVGFLVKLLDHCHNEYKTDRSRTYVTGASNGGMMTFRMLIDAPEQFAAGVAFIATMPVESPHAKTPAEPTPLMIMNGTEDPLIKWNGGQITRGRSNQLSTPDTVQWWAKAIKATGSKSAEEALEDSATDDGCRVYLTRYEAARNGAPLWFYRVEGGGHSPPTAAYPLQDNFLIRNVIGTTCRDVESADLAWAFMKQFQRDSKEDRSPDRPVNSKD